MQQQHLDRPLPSDLSAEKALIGSCLIERDAILTVRYIVSTDDFYLEKHAWIYTAILECLSNRVPPDIINVTSELRRRNQYEAIGGLTFIMELTETIPHGLHADSYARTIAKHGKSRRLIELGGKLTAAAYTQAPDEVLSDLKNEIALEKRIASSEWSGQAIDGLDIWRKQYPPPAFTIEQILPAGTFLLTGKSKSRKSWMALNFAYAVAAGGRALGQFIATKGDVLYIDLEMGERRINRRLRVLFPKHPPPHGVRFVEEWPAVGEGFEEQLERYLEMNPYTRLVIVDTLVAIRPRRDRNAEPYEQDKAFTQRLTDACHGTDITLLLVHHSRKMAGVDVVDDASGTMGLSGGVDNLGSLSRTDSKDGGMLRLVGRDIEVDDDLDLTWDSQLAQWNYQPPGDEIVSPERQIVQSLLRNQPGLYPKQVAERMRKPEHSVRRLLTTMRQAGQVESMSGQYYLIETESAYCA